MNKENIFTYKNAVNEYHDWRFRITSHFMIISSTVIALVASLSGQGTHNCCILYSLSSLAFLCATNILFGGIFLYNYVYVSSKQADRIREILDNPELLENCGSKGVIVSVKIPGFFSLCAKISWISFLLMVISLAWYAVLKIN